MNKTITALAILLFSIASLAIGGVIYVPSGPVSGKWETGDSVVVAAGAFIESETLLEVESGVRIFFQSVGRFEVDGILRMNGSVDAPIIVSCAEGWRGFRLRGEPGWHTVNYVRITEDRGLARRAVEVAGSSLEMNGCKFVVAENCLRFDGGQLHARGNQFYTKGLYSKVVELNGMQGFASEDCGASPGNVFRDNYLHAEVTQVNPGDPIDPFDATAGLWVDYCTNICLSYNDVTVIAPLSVVGVRFGNVPNFGDQLWELSHSTVYAQSSTLSSIGILNEVDGDLDVSKLTITVRGAQGFSSSCFFASRTSYIRISSTTTVMGSPDDIYYNTSGAGRIDANYIVKWVLEEGTLDNGMRPNTVDDPLLEGDEFVAVNVGDSVWDNDPLFEAQGAWGAWQDASEIAAFFSLRSMSPCIDRGDPDRGYDPDETRLDIGRYYFDQTTTGVDDPPVGVVAASSMGAAYPNPFNPSTILPIEIAHPGVLRVVVWDILGRVVYEQAEAVNQPGLQNVHFDAVNLASGIYLAQAELDGQLIGGQKLALVK